MEFSQEATKGNSFGSMTTALLCLKHRGSAKRLHVLPPASCWASFVGAGVFTLTQEGWTKALDYPYGASEGEHWAQLAEEDGVVAYATNSMMPGHLIGNKWECTGSTALWVSEGANWVRVDAVKAVKH